MNNILRWKLLGEQVIEVLDFDGGISNVDELTWRNYQSAMRWNESEVLSVSELVREAFYAMALSEITTENSLYYEADDGNNEADTELFGYVTDNNPLFNRLNKVDRVNATLMEGLKYEYYYTNIRLREIRNSEENADISRSIEDYFSALAEIIIHDNRSNYEDYYPELNFIREFQVEDIAISELVRRINEAITENANIIGAGWLYEAVFDWITDDSNYRTNSKYELKRRLIRYLIEGGLFFDNNYYREYYWRDNVYWLRYEDRFISLLFNFVDDGGFNGIVDRMLVSFNNIVSDFQQRFCNMAYIRTRHIKNDDTLDMLIRELYRYGDLEVYVNKNKCFAFMRMKDCEESYFALSGLDISKKRAYKDVEAILEKHKCYRVSFECQKVKENVFYCLHRDISKRLTYDNYEKYISMNNIPNNDGRMFSCSERKLFTKMVVGKRYRIFVRFTSCYMCKDMATALRRMARYKFKVVAGEKSDDKKLAEADMYDKKAEKYIKAIELN